MLYVKINEYSCHKNRKSVFKNIIPHALAGASFCLSSLNGRLTFLVCICLAFSWPIFSARFHHLSSRFSQLRREHGSCEECGLSWLRQMRLWCGGNNRGLLQDSSVLCPCSSCRNFKETSTKQHGCATIL